MENEDQREFWSGDVGTRWVDMADFLDAGFSRVTAAILDAAELRPDATLLDVGCGAGALSRAAAPRVRRITAVDISQTMLDAARRQAPDNVHYHAADAQTDTLPAAPFDAVISQFGMMFFADTVAAFAHIRAACRPGAQLTFATWAPVEDNPWFRVPREIAVASTGPVETDPDAPGPLRMRDIPTVNGWLCRAGWREVDGTARALHMPLPGTLSDVAYKSTRVGGASVVLAQHDADKPTRRAVTDRIAEAFAPYAREARVDVPATVNIFTARA